MRDSTEWFGEQIGDIEAIRNMDDVDLPPIHTFSNEVHTNRDVFHTCVAVRVMGASNGSGVITMQSGGSILRET